MKLTIFDIWLKEVLEISEECYNIKIDLEEYYYDWLEHFEDGLSPSNAVALEYSNL